MEKDRVFFASNGDELDHSTIQFLRQRLETKNLLGFHMSERLDVLRLGYRKGRDLGLLLILRLLLGLWGPMVSTSRR